MDRYIGIPIIFLLGRLKGRVIVNPPSEVNNILIIKIGAIGDTLLIIPILKAIKAAYPWVFMTVVGSKNNREVLERYDFINAVEILELANLVKKPQYFLEFIKRLNHRQSDIVLDFEPWPRISAIITSLVKGRIKIGFKTENEHRHFGFHISIGHSDECHEIENYISLAKAAGINVFSRSLEFPILSDDNAAVETFLRENKIGRFIVLHPWGSGYKGHLREWGIKNSADFINIMMKEGYDVIVTGTNNDNLKAQSIMKVVPKGFFSACGRFTLGETAYLIRESSLLVTVNTGIMHIGAAMNHPMIALHGPTNVKRWGPVGSSRSYNIKSQRDCSPCLNLGFEYKCGAGGCMDTIKAESVAKKALEVIKNNTKEVKGC